MLIPSPLGPAICPPPFTEMTKDINNKFATVLNLIFGKKPAQMGTDCWPAYVQLLGDLFVRHTRKKQFDYLRLSWR